MASDMASMFKALLEAQEREMTWNPTSHHGFESSSTYQDELLNGNFPPVDQYGYGESCQSWNMAHHYGATYPGIDHIDRSGRSMPVQSSQTYPSPTPNEEEIYNMFKLLLEGQEASNKMLRDQTWDMEPAHGEAHSSPISLEDNYNMLQLVLEEQEKLSKSFWEEQEKINKSLDMLSAKMRDWNQDLKVAAPTHEENAEIKDEFLQEAEKTVAEFELQEAEKIVAEFELLLGCTVDENLVIRYEDPCDDGLVAECLDNERMHMQLICQQETEGAKPKEKAEIHMEEATDEVRPELSPKAQPFDKYLGALLTHAVSFHDPGKIPFEEIRMKEFRGWFYDEYDPGDRNPCYTPL